MTRDEIRPGLGMEMITRPVFASHRDHRASPICAKTVPEGRSAGQQLVLRWGLFLSLTLAIAAVARHALATLAMLAWGHPEYTHTLLILPIAIALISARRERVFQFPYWELPAASSLAAVGALLAVAGRSSHHSLTFSIAATVAFCISAFVCCFGVEAAQRTRFPLLLLLLVVPLPDFVLNGLIAALQKGSVHVAYGLLHGIGIPVSRDGVLLHLAGLDLEVAAECSSFRSSMLLLVVSLVLADRLLGNWWRKLLAILMVVPVAILKNGIRIFTIATLATYFDADILSSWIHRDGGFLFFSLAVAMMVGFIRLLSADYKALIRYSKARSTVNLRLTP